MSAPQNKEEVARLLSGRVTHNVPRLPVHLVVEREGDVREVVWAPSGEVVSYPRPAEESAYIVPFQPPQSNWEQPTDEQILRDVEAGKRAMLSQLSAHAGLLAWYRDLVKRLSQEDKP